MKIITSLRVLLPLLMACTASGQFMDFLGGIFGGDDKPDNKADKEAEKETKEDKKNNEAATESMMLRLNENPIFGPVMSRFGDYATGAAGVEVAQGQRAYECMTAINSDKSRGFQFTLPEGLMRPISYGLVYQLFNSDEDIDVICSSQETIDEGRALAADNKNNLRRRTQGQQTFGLGYMPNYPSLNPDTRGFSIKNKHVASFLASDDLNNRTAIGALVDQLNEEIDVYQTCGENWQVAGEVIVAIGEFISTAVPEASVVVVGLNIDVGSFFRGTGELFQTLSTTLDANISRRRRTLSKIENHRSQIDSAEIEASFKNSQALLGEMAALKKEVAELERRTRE